MCGLGLTIGVWALVMGIPLFLLISTIITYVDRLVGIEQKKNTGVDPKTKNQKGNALMVIHAKRERPSLRLPASHVNTSRYCDGEKESKFNSTSGCGCHSGGAGGVSPSCLALPTAYTPATTYSLSISMTGSPRAEASTPKSARSTVKPKQCGTGVLQRLPGDPQYVDEHLMDRGLDGPGNGSGSVQVDLAVLHGNNGQNTLATSTEPVQLP